MEEAHAETGSTQAKSGASAQPNDDHTRSLSVLPPQASTGEVFQKLEDSEITAQILTHVALFFTNNYGVWGPLAESKLGSWAKQGRRIRMTAKFLQQKCLPEGARNTLVRLLVDGSAAGHLCASRWEHEGRTICWITQLCVRSDCRRRGYATKMIRELRKVELDAVFGILSSHPAAIRAGLRAFNVNPDAYVNVARREAERIMALCPVEYVRTAQLPEGRLLPHADTKFYVDHAEPIEVLNEMEGDGVQYPYGDLPEGYEYLLLAKCGNL